MQFKLTARTGIRRTTIAAAIVGLSSWTFAPNAAADVIISTGATTNISCSSGVCTPSKKTAVLNVTQLQNLLVSSNVTVTTDGAKASNIVVSTTVNWVSNNALTLDAYQSLTVNKPIVVGGTGGLTVLTDDGGTGGAFTFGTNGDVSFWSLSSALVINGDAFTLVNNIASLAADVASKPSGDYALANSYNASADGTYPAAPVSTVFNGIFEGLGNTISSLSIADTVNAGHDALFAQTNTSSEIRHVNLTKETVSGSTNSSAAGLVAISEGTLSADSVSGKFSGLQGSSVGSLAVLNDGTISHSHAAGIVRSSVGGVDGGLVSGNNTNGLITYSYSTATISGGHTSAIGGLVGDNDGGQISYCYATGSVTGASKSLAGGLVGQNQGYIATSYATGSVTGGTEKGPVGGLVGNNLGVVANSYATGAVTASNEAYVGGLIGRNGELGIPGTAVSDSYSTGAVTDSGDATLGAFVGSDYSPDNNNPGDISDSYWNTTSSGVTASNDGAGHPNNDPGITGLTTTQLQSGLPTGFSSTIWGENPGINGGLPYLLALPPN
jgi:hypothetical protein